MYAVQVRHFRSLGCLTHTLTPTHTTLPKVISIVFVVGAWVQQVGAFLLFNGDSFCSFDAEFSAAGIRATVLIGCAVRRFLALDPAKHALVL